MISRDTHHAGGSWQASYLSILAIIMASIAIGLWFWRGPPALRAAIALRSKRPRDAREGRSRRASAAAAAEVTAGLAK